MTSSSTSSFSGGSPADALLTATCFIVRDGSVLLQERRPGRRWAGVLNGPGGKIEPGETPVQAIEREVSEETGLLIHEPTSHGIVRLVLKGPPQHELLIHIFTVTEFSGEPHGVEDPLHWFPREHLPYARMWPDQRYWLPLVLDGGRLEVSCLFDEERFALERCELHLKL